jgi:choline dehydrogenase-like flavoprotein
MFALVAFAECLPRPENRVTLDPVKKDSQGLSQIHIRMTYGENEKAAMSEAAEEAKKMLDIMGGTVALSFSEPGTPGTAIHEMGGARMGRDPASSVLDAHNQAHDVQNLFITDGACMASSACQNPSLTYMALTARACSHAVQQLKSGAL